MDKVNNTKDLSDIHKTLQSLILCNVIIASCNVIIIIIIVIIIQINVQQFIDRCSDHRYVT